MARTPTLALWFLRTLGSGDSIEVLIGDLTEECEWGRSRGWLWWQVGAAIIAALLDTIRQHPYLTLRAIAVGWTTVTTLIVGGRLLIERLVFPLPPEFPQWVRQAPFFPVAWATAAYFVSGSVVAQVHRQHRLALVLVTMLFMALHNAIIVGWRTYHLLTHPPADASLMGRLSVLNSGIFVLLPLLVAVGGLWAQGISQQPKPARG
jgi:hypothetical protein